MVGLRHSGKRITRLLTGLCGMIWLLLPAAAQEPDSMTMIRFAQFSPDVDAVDVYIDGEATDVADLAFGTVSEWLSLASDAYRVAVVPSDSSVDEALVGPAELALPADDWLTVALVGSREAGTLRAQVITENYDEVPPGETRLSFFHAIENGPAVDLLDEGEALLQRVSFAGSATGDDGAPNDGFAIVTVVARVYEFQIVESEDPEVLLLDLGDFALAANQNTFMALIGTPEAPQVVRADTTLDISGVGTVTDAELGDGTGFLRFAHFSSGTPDIDVYLDGALSEVQQLSFSNVTAYTELAAGIYTVDIAPVNTSINDRVIGPVEVRLATDSYVTVAAIGTLANSTLAAQVFAEDYTNLSPLRTGISVFHAIPGLGPVDVIVNGQTRIGLLGYPGSQGSNDGLATFDLPRGTYDVQVVLSERPGEVLANLQDIRLNGDRLYLITLVVAEPPFLLTTTAVEDLDDDE